MLNRFATREATHIQKFSYQKSSSVLLVANQTYAKTLQVPKYDQEDCRLTPFSPNVHVI